MHIAEPVRELDKAYITLNEEDLKRIRTYKIMRSENIHSIRYININRKYDAHLYVSCSGKLRLAVIVRDPFRLATRFKEKIFGIDLYNPEPGLTYLQDDKAENNFILYIVKE